MEKKMRTIFFLFALIILTGCSTGPNWVQAGKTKQDMKYDRIDCYDSLIREHNQFAAGFTDKQIKDLMAKCMQAQGYHEESKTKN